MKTNLPARDFIPHREPMLWVKTLLEIDDENAVCEAVLDDDFLPFFDESGAFPAHLLTEIVAQTIGVWAGWHDRQRGIPVQAGMLLGCRRFSCEKDAFPRGARLRVHVKKLVEDNGTGSFEGTVFFDNLAVASATITTHKTSWEKLSEILVR